MKPYEIAAMLSAVYDGHEGRLGPGVGVKAADKGVQVVMPGVTGTSRRNLDIVRMIRLWAMSSRTDGRFPADVLNFHGYSTDNQADPSDETPEQAHMLEGLRELVAWRDAYEPRMELWLTEFGYDTAQGSVDRAKAYAQFSAEEVQAMWLVRGFMLASIARVDRAHIYMLRNVNDRGGTKFETCGLTSSKQTQWKPKLSFYFVYTVTSLLGHMRLSSHTIDNSTRTYTAGFKADPSAAPQSGGASHAFVVWLGTSVGASKSYSLDLQGTATGSADVTLVQLVVNSTSGKQSSLPTSNGRVKLTISEVPLIVLVGAKPAPPTGPVPPIDAPIPFACKQSNGQPMGPGLYCDGNQSHPSSSYRVCPSGAVQTCPNGDICSQTTDGVVKCTTDPQSPCANKEPGLYCDAAAKPAKDWPDGYVVCPADTTFYCPTATPHCSQNKTRVQCSAKALWPRKTDDDEPVGHRCNYEEGNGLFWSTYGGPVQRSVVSPGSLKLIDDVLSFDFVAGIAHYQNWSTLEVSEGKFNFTVLDAAFAAASSRNKSVILGLQAGVCAPSWLLQSEGVATARFVHSNPGWFGWASLQSHVQGVPVITFARPWDNPLYEQALERTLRALAHRYAGHPALAYVNVVGLSASAGVEANFNVNLRSSRKVVPGYDEQMNYTQEKFIAGWKNRIDRHLALFPRVGMATHDQPGDAGWEGGRVVEYTVEQKMATARSIRDHLLDRAGLEGRPVVRNCGGSNDSSVWGQPGVTVGGPQDLPAPKDFALLLWEVRQRAHLGVEQGRIVPRSASAPEQLQYIKEALEIQRYYNIRFIELKTPDIVDVGGHCVIKHRPEPCDKPHAEFVPVLQQTASKMRAGSPLPWNCTRAMETPPPIKCTDDEALPGDAYATTALGKTLFDQVLSKLGARHAAVAALGDDKAKWEQRQKHVQESLKRLFAPLPPADRSRTPRSLERGVLRDEAGGFSVTRLLIETRPGYWAPAALWLPKMPGIGKKVPAVLFPSGHSDTSFREAGAQLIEQNLVRRGFAVLGYDPVGQGERRMTIELDGSGGSVAEGLEHFSPSFEHEYLQRQSTLLGVNVASLWAADLTVLVDFLETHRSIDPSRLAVAGCSGGGVQTAYIGALDERLAAVSIACYTSTLTVDYKPSTAPIPNGGGGPAEGEQEWGPWVGAGLDKPDLLQVRAPRPTQVLLTTRDQYFALTGGEAAFNESVPAFIALGQASALELAIANNSHGYVNGTRMALYSFLSRILLGRNDSGTELEPTGTFSFSQLRATSTGSVLDAPELNGGNGSITSHAAFVLPIAEQRLAKLRNARKGVGFLRSVRANAARVVGYVPPASPTATRLSDGTNGSKVYSLPGEGRCHAKLEVLPPLSVVHTASQAVLYVSRKGSSLHAPRMDLSPVEKQRVEAIRRRGFSVALLDPCGFGTLGNGNRTTCTTVGGNATGGNVCRLPFVYNGVEHKTCIDLDNDGKNWCLTVDQHHWGECVCGSDDAFGLFELPSYAFRTQESSLIDVAFNLNRSIVGLHAADVVRAATALTTDGTLPGSSASTIVATIAANDTAPAVLTAALVAAYDKQTTAPLLGNLALLSSVSSWESIATSPRYDMSI